MADTDQNSSTTNTDNNPNIDDDVKKTFDSTDTSNTIEINVESKVEHNVTEIKDPDISEHSNIIILGKYPPGVNEETQNESVQYKRISANELKFLGVTEIKDEDEKYDVFGDNDNVYKKYRLRESVNKPNYKIPSMEDIPEADETLLPHYNRPNFGKFPCPHCDKFNETKTDLRNHIRSAHNIKYTCSQCFETFDSNEKLISHKDLHETENKSHICSKCRVAFSNYFDYLLHMFHHTKQPTFKCVECGLKYKRATFHPHMITHFRSISCRKCSRKFLTETQLKDHLKIHVTLAKHLQCVECDKKFEEKYKLDNHMLIHTGMKPHQCLYCGKGFRTTGQRKVHTRIHTQERPYACSKCDRKFIQSTDLQKHMERHDTSKIYKCEVCKKKYTSRSNLKNHMKIHAKKFDCPECDKSFSTSTFLRNHALYQHSTERLVECKACNKSFASNSHLYKHKSSKAHKRHEFRLKLEKTEI